MFTKLKQRYREWKLARFLKREGFSSIELYNRWYDPLVNQRAHTVNEFYKGYNYVVAIENRSNYAYKLLYDYGPGGYKYGAHEMLEWCEENCKGKFRMDMKRVGRFATWPGNAEWCITDIGADGDYWFYAFTDDEDAMWFRLKWS